MNMQGMEVFTKLDLSSAYHQKRVDKKSQKYTAFTNPFGNYKYQVMPFGLSTAPAIFQRAITGTLFEYVGEEVAEYLDNINIATDNLMNNKQKTKQIIDTLIFYRSRGNAKK
jgi:Reverse transcriptase (RNA-dependent DNA polymerase)